MMIMMMIIMLMMKRMMRTDREQQRDRKGGMVVDTKVNRSGDVPPSRRCLPTSALNFTQSGLADILHNIILSTT